MSPKYKALSHKRLLEILDYDPRSGEFRWKKIVNSRRPMREGAIAGTIDKKNARVIAIKGYLYYAHRLAWFYVYGKWPNGDIDHKNRDSLDNSIRNLRQATKSQNNANTAARSHNVVGIKGVHKHRNRYTAMVTIKKRVTYLGSFKTPEKAHAAYLAKAKKIYGEFARGG